MNSLPTPFWMVLADNSRETSVRHVTPENAQREAKRLALKHPGIRFFVLQVVGEAKTPEPVQWTDYGAYADDFEIPF